MRMLKMQALLEQQEGFINDLKAQNLKLLGKGQAPPPTENPDDALCLHTNARMQYAHNC